MFSILKNSVVALIFMVCLVSSVSAREMPMDVKRIVFGSCNKHDYPQPLWDPIVSNHPDVFIWGGDIVYNNTKNMKRMRENYLLQNMQPGYQHLKNSLLPGRLLGVWDDNDYGLDNGGKFFTKRDAAQNQLLDFLGEPKGSYRRGTAGVYTSSTFSHGKSLITIILLDTRYFREDPGETADILGEQQWRWLEEVFTQSRSSLHFVVSSIQFVSEEHSYESWAKFPAAKQRMLHLIRELAVPGVIFLSGDRHFGELSVLNDPEKVDYPLYDLTSSGMTHSWEELEGEDNEHREGDIFTGLNFGYIDIDLQFPAPRLFLQVRDKDNHPRVSREILLKDLQMTPQ